MYFSLKINVLQTVLEVPLINLVFCFFAYYIVGEKNMISLYSVENRRGYQIALLTNIFIVKKNTQVFLFFLHFLIRSLKNT